MRFCTIVLLTCALALPLRAQRPTNPAPRMERDTTPKFTPIPSETSSVTDHTIRVGGQVVPYRATAGTMLLKNDKDEASGVLYYTAHTRSDAKDPSQRPIPFLYNGAPRPACPARHLRSTCRRPATHRAP